jgi:hypothetical protein
MLNYGFRYTHIRYMPVEYHLCPKSSLNLLALCNTVKENNITWVTHESNDLTVAGQKLIDDLSIKGPEAILKQGNKEQN